MGRNHLQEQQVPKDPTIYSPGHATRQDHRVLASVSRGYPCLQGSLITCYSPVRHFTRLATFTCDLHASSTPPTFVLSQDQTLHLEGLRSSVWSTPTGLPPCRHRPAAGRLAPTHSIRSHARLRGHPECQRSAPKATLGGGRGRVATSTAPSRMPCEKGPPPALALVDEARPVALFGGIEPERVRPRGLRES